MRQEHGSYHWLLYKGRLAQWNNITTGPVQKTELLPSHAACEGMLRNTFGKREYRWDTREVRLLSAGPRFVETYNAFKSAEPPKKTLPGTKIPVPFAHDGSIHTQRTQEYLMDMVIAVRARLVLGKNAAEEDTIPKGESMFLRRAKRGEIFRRPYFGKTECLVAPPRYIQDPSTLPAPLDVTLDMGIRYFDTDYDRDPVFMYYLPMWIEHGVMLFPEWDEVRETGLRRARQ